MRRPMERDTRVSPRHAPVIEGGGKRNTLVIA